MSKLEGIVSLCKRRGFIFQGSEVYGGMAGTWDFGPLGVMLKRNLMNLWWKFWVLRREDILGVDAAILMNPRTWVASGHTETFSDPLVECKECHQRFRADKLADDLPEHPSEEDIAEIKCPNCGKKNWSEIREFNMMFRTKVGAVDDEKAVAYFRPETAQGIFTNYKNVVDSIYPTVPFGLAQQGKAFRNEISPRDFIFRDRECEQMEIEYFVKPENWEEEFEKLLVECRKFLFAEIGLPEEMIHEEEVAAEDRAHYSKRTVDVNFDFPFGADELLGLAYRTDFDLKNIERESGKSMGYRDKITGETFVPHVIEPSFGVERLVLAVLTAFYDEEKGVLRLPEKLAPYKFCVSPLLKNKPELVEKAREVYAKLRERDIYVAWDDSGNIGKRYKKQDEIGTPKCVVVDFQTLEDGTVTVRDRDTGEQVRVEVGEI